MKARLSKLLKEDGITLAVVLALAIAYIVLRTPGDTFASVEEFESGLMTGKPDSRRVLLQYLQHLPGLKTESGSPGI